MRRWWPMSLESQMDALLLKPLPPTHITCCVGRRGWVFHWHLFVAQVHPDCAVYSSCFVRAEAGAVSLMVVNVSGIGWFSWQDFTRSWSIMTSWSCYLFTSSKSKWWPSCSDLFACSVLHHWGKGLPRRHTWALCSQCLLWSGLAPSHAAVFKSVVLLFCYVVWQKGARSLAFIK